jgi:hypothetical protein
MSIFPSPAHAADFLKSSLDAAAVTAAVTASVAILLLESQATKDEFDRRAPGDPVLPDLRLDQSYQVVGNAAQGSSSRLQVGYAMLGADFEFLHYWERHPTVNLDYGKAEILFRMSDRPSFRVDLAYGYRGESPDAHGLKPQAGFSLGAYSDSGLGLESDLRWTDLQGSTVLGDGRLRVVWRIDEGHLALFGGYRALRVASGKRDGPEGGLTLTW